MATSTDSSTSKSDKYDRYLDERIGQTVQQVRWVELLSFFLILSVFVLGALFVLCLVDAWIVELNVWMRWSALAVLVAGGLGFTIYRALPFLIHRVNPLYAAKKLEEGRPELKNSVINYLTTQKNSGKSVDSSIQKRLSQQAATDVANIPLDVTVDRSPMILAGYALAGVVAIFALYKVLSPKDPFQTIKRVVLPSAGLMAPSRVRISDVEPGNTQKYFGESLEISARIKGLRDGELPTILISSESGSQDSQTRALSRDLDSDLFKIVIGEDGGLRESFSYKIQAGDATTIVHHVDVRTCPTVFVEQVQYQPPAYTRIPSRTESNPEMISGVEGTRAKIFARTNLPIESAYLKLYRKESSRKDSDGKESADANQKGDDSDAWKVAKSIRLEVADQFQATGELILELNGKRTQARFSHFQVVFTAEDGSKSENPAFSRLEVIPDLSPEIEVTAPTEKVVEVPADQTEKVELSAVDPDYGLTSVVIIAEQKGTRLFEKQVFRSETVQGQKGNQFSSFSFRPDRFGLKAGDEVVWFARAEDNRTVGAESVLAPNRSRTANYKFVVTSPLNSGDNANQNEPNDPENKNDSGDSNDQKQDPNKKSDPSSNEKNKQGQKGKSPEKNEPAKDKKQPGEKEKEGKGQSGKGQPDKGEQGKGQPDKSNKGKGQGEKGTSQKDRKDQSKRPDSGGKDRKNDEKNSQNGKSGKSASGKSNPKQSESQDKNNSGKSAKQNQDSKGSENSSNNNPSKSESDSSTGKSTPNNSTGSESAKTKKGSGDDSTGNQKNQLNENDASGNSQNESSENSTGADSNESQGGKPQNSKEAFERLKKYFDKKDQEKPERSTGDKKPGKEKSDQPNDPSKSNSAGTDKGDKSKTEKPDKGSSSGNKESQEKKSPGKKSDSPKSNGKGGGKQKEKQSTDPANKTDGKKGGDPKSGQGKKKGPTKDKSESSKKNPGTKSGNQKKKGGEDAAGQKQNPNQKSGEPGNRKNPNTDGKKGDNPANKSGDKGKSNQNSKDKSGNQKKGDSSSGNTDDRQPQKNSGGDTGNVNQSDSKAGQESNRSNNKSSTGQNRPETQAEKANLDYTKKTTEMVLEKLADQKEKPDEDLLKDLNWTEEELRDFSKKWEAMRQKAQSGSAKDKRRFDEALRSLGLKNPDMNADGAKLKNDDRAGYRQRSGTREVPSDFARKFRAIQKSQRKLDKNQ